MKARGKDLDRAYAQLKEYVFHLPAEDIPELLMVCDFENIRLSDDPQERTSALNQRSAQAHPAVCRYCRV